jgi:hypothetical protein
MNTVLQSNCRQLSNGNMPSKEESYETYLFSFYAITNRSSLFNNGG